MTKQQMVELCTDRGGGGGYTECHRSHLTL